MKPGYAECFVRDLLEAISQTDLEIVGEVLEVSILIPADETALICKLATELAIPECDTGVDGNIKFIEGVTILAHLGSKFIAAILGNAVTKKVI